MHEQMGDGCSRKRPCLIGDYARACLAIKSGARPVRMIDGWIENKKTRFRGVLCVAGGQGGLSADLRLVPARDDGVQRVASRSKRN